MPAFLDAALGADVRALLLSSAETRDLRLLLALPAARRGSDALATLLGGAGSRGAEHKRKVLALAVRPAEAQTPEALRWRAVLLILRQDAKAGTAAAAAAAAAAAVAASGAGSARSRPASGAAGSGAGAPAGGALGGGGSLAVQDTLKLKHLTRLEGGAADADGRSREALLVFESSALARHAEHYAFDAPDARQLLLGACWHLAAEGGEAPALAGVAAASLRAWAEDAAKQLSLPRRGTFADGARVPGHPDAEDSDGSDSEREARPSAGTSAAGGPASAPHKQALVSDDEAKALKQLLEAYRLDVGDADVLEERLRREAAALEAANVHALLEADADLASLMNLLGGATLQLEDLSMWLDVFNVKLTHMRSDIAAIESRNNRLERQSRNAAAVTGPLSALLAALKPPPGLERALGGALSAGPELRAAAKAAGALGTALEALKPAALPPGADGMRAVREQRQQLLRARAEFVSRAGGHARRTIADTLENAAAAGRRGRDAATGLPRAHDPAPARAALRELAPLLAALTSLEPSAAEALRAAHAAAGASALRRAARELAAGARAASKEDATRAPPAKAAAALLAEAVPLALGEADFMLELVFPGVALSDGARVAKKKAPPKAPKQRRPKAAKPPRRDRDSDDDTDEEEEEDEEDDSETEDDSDEASEPAEEEDEEEHAGAGGDDAEAADAALGALLAGLAPELCAAVDWATRGDPAATAVPVLRAVDRARRGCAGRPGGAHVAAACDDAAAVAATALERAVAERAGALAKAEGADSGGIASLLGAAGARHDIMPELAKALALLARLEAAASDGGDTRRGSGDAARTAVDAVYSRLIPAALAAAERASGADREHAEEIRLRNVAAVVAALKPLGSGSSSLAPLVKSARATAAQALDAYVDMLLGRSFGAPLALLARIEALLATGMGAEAVAFQAGLSRTDVRRMLKEALGSRRAERGVQEAHARAAKHLGRAPPPLFEDAWAAAHATLLERYGRLETLVGQVYGDSLAPSASELEELFKTV
jgi:hypothetical protein